MTEFVSNVKKIPHPISDIFSVLSDLNNLEYVKGSLPEDKIKSIVYDRDSCTVNVDPVGYLTFEIIERIENSTIKLKGKNLPAEMFLWIQLVEKDTKDTRLKLTIKADLNMFLKPMLSKPLREGIEKLAGMLTTLPYTEIAEKNKQ